MTLGKNPVRTPHICQQQDKKRDPVARSKNLKKEKKCLD
jgi:hypothetical protein